MLFTGIFYYLAMIYPLKYDRTRSVRKPKRVLKRNKSPKTTPEPSPENSSDDEPDGILTFSPVQDKETGELQSSQVSPANHDANEETSHGGDAAES